MQKTRFNKMKPYIEIKPYPINNVLNNFEEDHDINPLYHVSVSQGQLKMLFLVILNDHENTALRKFETIRCEYVSLHGINERDKYLEVVDNLSISADVTIVNEIFEWTLKPYGIKLLKASFHDFQFFESDKEGKGFIFEDQEIYNKLKDLIDKKCDRMIAKALSN